MQLHLHRDQSHLINPHFYLTFHYWAMEKNGTLANCGVKLCCFHLDDNGMFNYPQSASNNISLDTQIQEKRFAINLVRVERKWLYM